MNISIFINSFTSGGAEKVVLTLLDKFQQRKKELDLIIIEKEKFYEIPSDIPSTYLTQFNSLEKGPLKIPSLFVCASKLKKHVESNDIKIVQSHLIRATFINGLAKMLGSKHYAQAIIHSQMNFDHQPWILRIFSKWIYRKIHFQMDSIISISDVMKYELDEYLGFKNHPNHIRIYNPHNLDDVKKMSEEVPTDFVFSPDKKYFISIGRLAKLKRLGDVIKAFSALENKNAELIFVGNGEEENRLKELTSQLGLENRIHFVGYQTNPYQYLSRADIFVSASETEGLPNTLIESMICGTPVISSDCVSGPREILHPESDLTLSLKDKMEHGSHGLLYPVGKVEYLAEAMNLLLENESLCNEFIQRGFSRMEEFEAMNIAQKYIDTFPSEGQEIAQI